VLNNRKLQVEQEQENEQKAALSHEEAGGQTQVEHAETPVEAAGESKPTSAQAAIEAIAEAPVSTSTLTTMPVVEAVRGSIVCGLVCLKG